MRALTLAGLLVGCGGGGGSFGGATGAVDAPLPDLPRAELARDSEGRGVIRVEFGRLSELESGIWTLRPGPTTFLVINRVEGAGVEVDGLDLSEQAIGLWLRGRGTQRHLRPEFALGPVNSGVQEDWEIDLPVGDYLLGVTAGGASETILLVR